MTAAKVMNKLLSLQVLMRLDSEVEAERDRPGGLHVQVVDVL